MKDIADDLGLSVVTISKVLRNHPDVSEKTRLRVMQRVNELHYRPNLNAQNLVTGRSSLIGLVVPDLLHPFFSEVAKALAHVVGKQGYSLVIASTEDDASIEEQEIERMIALQMDGIVIASSSNSVEVLKRLSDQHRSYLLIDRNLTDSAHNFVGTDDVAAGLIATRHLIDRGCKRIAHIRGGPHSTGEGRLEGYRQALTESRMHFDSKYIVAPESIETESRRLGRKAMKYLLEVAPPPDGVFCYNDPLAIGAMEAIYDAGLSIPDDVAVIGCGNLHYDDMLRVALSSIDQQSRLMGEEAGKLIVKIIQSKGTLPPISIVLEPHLICRASSER